MLKNSMVMDRFAKKTVRTYAALAALALCGLAAAGCGGDVSATPQDAKTLQAAVAPPARAAVPEKKTVSPKETWAAAVPRLDQADREAAAALESQLATINEFFAERKQGARPFATAVLGTDGKLQATGAAVEIAAGKLGELFGNKPASGPDSFTLYVGRSFRQHVLDTEQLQKAIDSAVAGYGREVRRLEGRLLVDLRADLDDAGISFAEALPEIRAGNAVAGHGDAMIAEATNAAAEDFGAMIVQFIVSQVIGNAIGDQLTSEDDSTLKKAGINFAVGIVVDKALDEAIAQAGYDPEGALAAKVTVSLDRMRSLLVDGDQEAVKALEVLRGWRRGHPDSAVRAACRKATDVIEQNAALGLKQSLRAMCDRRAEARRAALSRLILGSDEVAPSVDAKTLPPRDEILKYAQECAATWKGKKS